MHPAFNVPNLLTFARITAIPIILYVLGLDVETTVPLEQQTTFTPLTYGRIATLIFAFAALTDLLDGYFARRFNQVSRMGKLLDPMADKLMLVSFLLCLVDMDRIPWWMVVLVLTRELLISTLRAIAAEDGLSVDSVMMGKYKQFIYMVGIGGLMINGKFLWAHSGRTGLILIVAGLISSYVSFFEYVVKYIQAVRSKTLRRT